MTQTHESIAVFPAHIAVEGLVLQDGRMLTVAADEPPLVYVVTYRDGDEIIIASKHNTPGEAETAARALVKRMEQANAVVTDAAVDLDRIVKGAGRKLN